MFSGISASEGILEPHLAGFDTDLPPVVRNTSNLKVILCRYDHLFRLGE